MVEPPTHEYEGSGSRAGDARTVSTLSEIQNILYDQVNFSSIMAARSRWAVRAILLLLSVGVVALILIAVWLWRPTVGAIANLAGGALLFGAVVWLVRKVLAGDVSTKTTLVAGTAVAMGLLLLAAGRITLFDKLFDISIGPPELSIACLNCRGPTSGLGVVEFQMTVEPAFVLECGAPDRRRIGLFWHREPAAAGLRSAHADPLEEGNSDRQINGIVASLRAYHDAALDRSLAGLVLIGSTDERRIAPPAPDDPNRDNGHLALRRAQWVRDRLSQRMAPFAPSILLLNSEDSNQHYDMSVARLILLSRGRDRRRIETSTFREVVVCGVWRQSRAGRPGPH